MKVRDVLRCLELDGRYMARTRGSHRLFKHSVKKGIVVAAGHSGKEVGSGTLKSIWKQAELEDRS